MKFFFHILIYFAMILNALPSLSKEIQIHKIEILVNDNIITNYDIIQRMKLNAILSRTNISNENTNLIANSAAEELLIELLKQEKIREYEIDLTREEYAEQELRFLEMNKIDRQLFMNLLKENKIDQKSFKDKVSAEIKWQKLIYGLYFRVISVSKNEINDYISKNPELSLLQAEDILLQNQLNLKSEKLINDMRNEATIEFR